MCSWFLSQIAILSSMILPSSFSKSDHIPNSLIHSSIYWHKFHLHLQTWTIANSFIHQHKFHLHLQIWIIPNSFIHQHRFHSPSSNLIMYPNSFSHQHKFHSPSPNLIIYPNSFINTKFPFSIFKSDQLIHSFIHSSTQIPSPSFSPLVIHHLDFILSMDFHQF